MHPAPARRNKLPTPKQHEKSVSLWSILKECIGKDLTRVCLPVYFNEPLSVLQKTVEDLEYAELVNKVNHAAMANSFSESSHKLWSICNHVSAICNSLHSCHHTPPRQYACLRSECKLCLRCQSCMSPMLHSMLLIALSACAHSHPLLICSTDWWSCSNLVSCRLPRSLLTA